MQNSRILCICAGFSSVLFLSGGLLAQSGPNVWVAPSLQRVGPSDPPQSNTTAQLSAAKGETESFQIIVNAPSSLTNVNVGVSNLTSASGQTIFSNSLALFREKYIYVGSSSPDWGGSNRPLGAGWYADGLIPFQDAASGQAPVNASLQAAPFNVSAGGNQPVWVDVTVPRSAAAGQYTGSFWVTSDQGSASGQISLQVWNFSLPQTPALKTAFSFWSADSLAAEEELLRNRVSPTSVPLGNQSTLAGSYGLGLGTVSYFSGANVSTCTMAPAPSVAEFQAAAASNQPGLYLFDYSADEVNNCPGLYPYIRQWGYNMHQAGINNLVTMTPTSALFDDGSGTGRSAVDIWAMLPVMYDQNPAMVQQALAKGDSAWSYNTLVQDSYSPKWELDFAPMNFRIQPGFISESLGLSGLEYWRVDGWDSNPWYSLDNAGQYSSSNYPGEASLVYPGWTVGINGVAPSMRLKWIRDGIDDYDYVELLKQAGMGDWALQITRSVGPDWSNWTRDPNAVAAARQQLGQALDALGNAGN